MRRTVPTFIAWLALAISLASCASSGATAGASTSASSNPDRISSAELATAAGNSAFDIVRQLRPRWLQSNAPGSISGVRMQVTLVYLDGNKLGGLDALRTISAGGIKSMQYLDAVRAATILTDVGSDPIAGAILITTGQ